MVGVRVVIVSKNTLLGSVLGRHLSRDYLFKRLLSLSLK